MENTNERRMHLVPEIELTYKTDVRPYENFNVNASGEAFEILKEKWGEHKNKLSCEGDGISTLLMRSGPLFNTVL